MSVWILGMYKHSAETTVLVPYVEGDEAKLGPIVNADYFGTVPAERLRVADGVIHFSGDGQYRSKIGLTPQRAKPVLGSYDATRQLLTLVQYTCRRARPTTSTLCGNCRTNRSRATW